MSDGLNLAILAGNLGAEPELRFTASGSAVLNLRVATTERYEQKGEWKERTDWHSVVVWGKRGESLAKILKKGASVVVQGSIRTSSYKAQNGETRYKTEINAAQVIITGGARELPAQRGARADAPDFPGRGKPYETDEDIPF